MNYNYYELINLKKKRCKHESLCLNYFSKFIFSQMNKLVSGRLINDVK